jgi:hypothetical protein
VIGFSMATWAIPLVQANAQSAPLMFHWDGLYSANSGNTDPNTVTYPGYNSTPMLWHFDSMTPIAGSRAVPSARSQITYAWQYSGTIASPPGAHLGFIAQQDSAAVVGGNPLDADDIANTLRWFETQNFTLDYAFDDFEGQGTAGDWSNIGNLIDQVRGSTAGANAGIGSYGWFPGSLDISKPYPGEFDHRTDNGYYLSNASNGAAGLTVAMPSCYPYQSYAGHADDTYSWGPDWWRLTGLSAPVVQYLAQFLTYNQQAATGATYLSPNERAAMFYAPLEELSVAARNLPSGNFLIPWVAAFVPDTSIPVSYLQHGQAPTPQDNQALLEHFRLRGAVGFYAFGSQGPAYVGTYADGSSFTISSYDDYLGAMQSAWISMDWFFALPIEVGAVTANGPLNLDTFKNTGGTYVDLHGMNGGIEWSAYQRGNRILAVVSNLGNGDQSAAGNGVGNTGDWQSALSAISPFLPPTSPTVPAGNHLVLQYLSNPDTSNFESYGLDTMLGSAQGWQVSNPFFQVTAPQGTGNTSGRVVSVVNAAAMAWFSNADTANPGGIGDDANDTMVYSLKVFTGWAGDGNAAFAPVAGTGTAVPVAWQQNGPTVWVVVGGATEYWGFGNNFQSGGPYQSTTVRPLRNNWYQVDLVVAPSTNLASVYVKNLTAGDTAWTLLQFVDSTNAASGYLTAVDAGLMSGQDSPSLYNAFQILGSSGAQFDDISAQLYPYPTSPSPSYIPPELP